MNFSKLCAPLIRCVVLIWIKSTVYRSGQHRPQSKTKEWEGIFHFLVISSTSYISGSKPRVTLIAAQQLYVRTLQPSRVPMCQAVVVRIITTIWNRSANWAGVDSLFFFCSDYLTWFVKAYFLFVYHNNTILYCHHHHHHHHHSFTCQIQTVVHSSSKHASKQASKPWCQDAKMMR